MVKEDPSDTGARRPSLNSRRGLAEESFHSQFSTESENTNVLDLLAAEKAAAMNPEKAAIMQRTLDDYGVLRAIEPPVDAIERKQSTLRSSAISAPGAFRMGMDQASNDEFTVSGDSVMSDGSESCVVVVSRALLVKQEEERDIEAPRTEMPLVVAKEMVESVDSVAAQPRSESERKSSRCFRLSVLGCLLLIAVLLATLLVVFLGQNNDPSPISKKEPSQIPVPSPIQGSSPPPPPPPPYGGGNGGNGGGGGGNRGRGKF
jgi:hypothetical protein